MTGSPRRPGFTLVTALAGALATTFGAVALLGRVTGRSPFLWEPLAGITAPAAAAFCVMGLGVFVHSVAQPLTERRQGMRRLLPPLLLLAGAGASLWCWRILAVQDAAYARQAIRAQTEGTLRTLVDQMHMEETGLWRLAKLWEVRGGMTQRDWKIQAGTYLALQPAYRSITRLDPALTDRWTVSAEGLAERPWPDEAPAFRRALDEALARRSPVLSPGPRARGESELLVAVPIFSEGNPGGVILGSLRLKPLFDGILKDLPLQGYRVSLQDPDGTVYRLGDADAPGGDAWMQQRNLDLHGVAWSVQVRPSRALLGRLQSPFPEMVLGAVLLVSFMLSWIVSLSQTNEIRAHLLKSANARLAEEMMARTRALVLLKSAEEELTRSNQELARFSVTDPLTGLLNRRGLERQLALLAEEMRRDPAEAVVIQVDLDDFKHVNDSLGHAVGDLALGAAARACRDALREGDSAARIGGDEFLLLLPRTSLDDGRRIAQGLRLAICEGVIAHPGGSLSITASLGVVALPPGAATIDSLLVLAHDALYRSKLGGKNRIS